MEKVYSEPLVHWIHMLATVDINLGLSLSVPIFSLYLSDQSLQLYKSIIAPNNYIINFVGKQNNKGQNSIYCKKHGSVALFH